LNSFTKLKRNLKKDFSNFKKIKIAILGNVSTQFISQAIRGEGFDRDLDINIWEADFNQIEPQILNPSSELYEIQPDIIVIFKSSHKLLNKYNRLNPEHYANLASLELEIIESLVDSLENNIDAKIVYYNYSEIEDSVFGNFSNASEISFLFQLRKLNYELMLLASKHSSMFLCDLSTIQNQVSKEFLFQPSIYISTEMVLSIDVLPMVASKTVDLIGALHGKMIKCIVLDLDNTTWGGIIGDDGVENIQIGDLGIGKAFTEFQYWIKKLKNRGIIIAVCSKNTESIAKAPFIEHPDMILRLEDISVFVANWNNKADNIRYIQSVLNIGFDSIVFLDDNPFERNLVRESIPEICVPELPSDPADYLEYLYKLNLFETVSFSNEDTERTKLYQTEAKRKKIKENFTNEDEYLASLKMEATIEEFNRFNTPRVAQLSQRSNQFNLRTIRYDEAQIEKISNSNEYCTFAFSLKDKFGDNGLICVVILYKESSDFLFIDTWLMSCRVLKRGMEQFVLNSLVKYAKNNNFLFLKGEYIPTVKNEIVKHHYENLGFIQQDKYWNLDLDKVNNKNNSINIK
jgi:FkbH-like protein